MFSPAPYRPENSLPAFTGLSDALQLICLNPGQSQDGLAALLVRGERNPLTRLLQRLSWTGLKMPAGVRHIAPFSLTLALTEVDKLARKMTGRLDPDAAAAEYFRDELSGPVTVRKVVLARNQENIITAARLAVL